MSMILENSIVKKIFGDKPTAVLLPAALFALLVPGTLLTVGGRFQFVDFASGSNNMQVVLIHALVYAIVLNQLRNKFSQYY